MQARFAHERRSAPLRHLDRTPRPSRDGNRSPVGARVREVRVVPAVAARFERIEVGFGSHDGDFLDHLTERSGRMGLGSEPWAYRWM